MENKIDSTLLPKLVCLTPVRNEAWILHAFLKATSIWADYIIISDQGSTDGSREIALTYPKVILIDNPAVEMHQANTRKMLFDASRKIPGKKILFALDADEFLSGDFINTDSWRKILDSKVGEVFCFRWINLCSSTEAIFTERWMHWASIVDDNAQDSIFPDSYIHEWRLPYPKEVEKENLIEDISLIHFARINAERQDNKNLFYQVITKIKEPSKSFVSLFRMYHSEDNEPKSKVDNSIYSFYLNSNLDLFKEINLSDAKSYYTQQVLHYIEHKGIKHFSGLDIWEESFIKQNRLKDPRNIFYKSLHSYLRFTKKNSNTILVRLIDKILIKVGL
jgi:hypothetical protein